MLLLSPTDAALGIGAKCGGSAPTAEDQQLLSTLRYITPRVEGALNVDSLVRHQCQDVFFLGSMQSAQIHRQRVSMLLSNAFIVPGSVSIQLASGSPITGADADALVDFKYGVVTLESWERGACVIDYESGFAYPAAPEPPPEGYDIENSVLEDVPDWIKSIAISMLVIWYRTTVLAPRFPKDISFGQVSQAMNRELYARIYEKYMRPRVGMLFSERLTYGD